MQCNSASSDSSSAYPQAFIASLMALAMFLYFLDLLLSPLRALSRCLKITANQRTDPLTTSATTATAIHPAHQPTASASDLDALYQHTPDDFDPLSDEWSDWLDEPHVVEACRPHLSRCFDLTSASHDHRP